jgi:hypothetical protein
MLCAPGVANEASITGMPISVIVKDALRHDGRGRDLRRQLQAIMTG